MKIRVKIQYAVLQQAPHTTAVVSLRYSGTEVELVELSRVLNEPVRDLERTISRCLYATSPAEARSMAHDEITRRIDAAKKVVPEIVPDDEAFTVEW